VATGSNFDDDDEGTAVLSIGDLSPPAARVATPFLILLAGDEAGKMLRIEEELTIGRSPKSTVVFTGDGVSRYHARFFRQGAATLVEDLGSTNGTLVNGIRLTGPVALSDGDKIQIGASFLLKFSLQDALEQSFQQQLYEAALRDPLTKVYNRRAITRWSGLSAFQPCDHLTPRRRAGGRGRRYPRGSSCRREPRRPRRAPSGGAS
jgi:hypothetical protein